MIIVVFCKGKLLKDGNWTYGYAINIVDEKGEEHYCLSKVNGIVLNEAKSLLEREVDPTTICRRTGRTKDEWEFDVFEYEGNRYVIHYSESSAMWTALRVNTLNAKAFPLNRFPTVEYVKLGNTVNNPELSCRKV